MKALHDHQARPTCCYFFLKKLSTLLLPSLSTFFLISALALVFGVDDPFLPSVLTFLAEVGLLSFCSSSSSSEESSMTSEKERAIVLALVSSGLDSFFGFLTLGFSSAEVEVEWEEEAERDLLMSEEEEVEVPEDLDLEGEPELESARWSEVGAGFLVGEAAICLANMLERVPFFFARG